MDINEYHFLFKSIVDDWYRENDQGDSLLTYTDTRLFQMIEILRKTILDLQRQFPSAVTISLEEPADFEQLVDKIASYNKVSDNTRDLAAQIESLHDEVGRLEEIVKDHQTTITGMATHAAQVATKLFDLEHKERLRKPVRSTDSTLFTHEGYQTTIEDLRTKLKNEREFSRKYRLKAKEWYAELNQQNAPTSDQLAMEDIREIFKLLKHNGSVLISSISPQILAKPWYSVCVVHADYDSETDDLTAVSDTIAYASKHLHLEDATHLLRGKIETLSSEQS